MKRIIYLAQTLSIVFTPHYLPLVGMILLLALSHMKLLPWQYKLWVLGITWVCTILLPMLLIRLYRKANNWSRLQLGLRRRRRVIPYVSTLICFAVCDYLLRLIHAPMILRSIVIAAVFIQVLCQLANIRHKISTHMAGIGGVAGGLIGFSFVFYFNPLGWLCFILIVAGLLGTARMLLLRHTLGQVLGGFFVGLTVSLAIILLLF